MTHKDKEFFDLMVKRGAVQALSDHDRNAINGHNVKMALAAMKKMFDQNGLGTEVVVKSGKSLEDAEDIDLSEFHGTSPIPFLTACIATQEHLKEDVSIGGFIALMRSNYDSPCSALAHTRLYALGGLFTMVDTKKMTVRFDREWMKEIDGVEEAYQRTFDECPGMFKSPEEMEVLCEESTRMCKACIGSDGVSLYDHFIEALTGVPLTFEGGEA